MAANGDAAQNEQHFLKGRCNALTCSSKWPALTTPQAVHNDSITVQTLSSKHPSDDISMSK
jgi:hypothetical protein